MSEPMFPTIRAIMDEVLGDPQEEIEEVRETFREPTERGDNTNVV